MQVPLTISRNFNTESEWRSEWERRESRTHLRHPEDMVNTVILHIAKVLADEGFRLFRNGGIPLLERRRGPLREEIFFVTPVSTPFRNDFPFSVRFSASNEQLSVVRSRYWRPASQAPSLVAAGEIGNLSRLNQRTIWYAQSPQLVGELVLGTLRDAVLPWFDILEDPVLLREHLDRFDLRLVGRSTALELMLCEFGARAARHYWSRLRGELGVEVPFGVTSESEGLSIDSNRLPSIVSYYHLG